MIDLRQAAFSYRSGRPPVIRNISLRIEPGEKVLVVGRNGAGKTTLSKLLAGLIPHVERGEMSGDYLLDGTSVREHRYRDIVRRVAVLFQDFEAQIVSTGVLDELLFYPLNTGLDYATASERVRALAARFSLEHLLDREMGELSGGEKQKIAFLALLAVNPSVLILDEPFTDIEPATQEALLDFLNGYAGTVVLFEQVLDYHAYFDRVIVLCNGEVLRDGDRDIVADARVLDAAGLAMPALCRLGLSRRPVSVEECASIAKRRCSFDRKAHAAIIARDERSIAAAGEPLIEVRNLTFAYPGCARPVLDSVSLDIRRGDFVTVIGANGSGKTTLMKLVAGILPFADGDILFRGKSIRDDPGFAGTVGYVYQNPDNQIFAETVFDEVGFILKMRGVAGHELESRVSGILSRMGLADRRDADPFALPKGDREKVACASIIVGEPEVIILDEPTTGLDYPSLAELMGIVSTLHRAGITILMITHSMETAAAYGSTILSMNEGRVLFYGNKREFFSNDALIEAARIKRTDIMDLSMRLNGRMLMDAEEFRACWKRKR